jgi:hypothetical protein
MMVKMAIQTMANRVPPGADVIPGLSVMDGIAVVSKQLS